MNIHVHLVYLSSVCLDFWASLYFLFVQWSLFYLFILLSIPISNYSRKLLIDKIQMQSSRTDHFKKFKWTHYQWTKNTKEVNYFILAVGNNFSHCHLSIFSERLTMLFPLKDAWGCVIICLEMEKASDWLWSVRYLQEYVTIRSGWPWLLWLRTLSSNKAEAQCQTLNSN